MNNIYLARNLAFHARLKHIEIHYHFIKKLVLVDDVNLVHVNTRQLQIRDVFTKALGVEQEEFRRGIGVQRLAIADE